MNDGLDQIAAVETPVDETPEPLPEIVIVAVDPLTENVFPAPAKFNVVIP